MTMLVLSVALSILVAQADTAQTRWPAQQASSADRKPIAVDSTHSNPAPAPGAWEIGLAHNVQAVEESSSSWSTTTASVGRRSAGGALFLHAIRTERGPLQDASLFVDAYLDLWKGSYGNLNIQVTQEAEVLPRRAYGVQLFQDVGRGWELSGQYRRQEFASSDVNLAQVGVARYAGQWYIRGRTLVSSIGDGLEPSIALSGRRYLGSPERFFELTLGGGKEVLDLVPVGSTAQLRVVTDHTQFLSVRAQRDLVSWLGIAAVANYSRYQNYVDRRGLHVGLTARM